MDIKNYMAKNNPKKSLEEHTNDLLSSLEIMNDLGYIRDQEIYNLVKKACYYHDFGKVNEIYAKYFEGACPARSCVEVSKLPKGVLMEMEAIAAK